MFLKRSSRFYARVVTSRVCISSRATKVLTKERPFFSGGFCCLYCFQLDLPHCNSVYLPRGNNGGQRGVVARAREILLFVSKSPEWVSFQHRLAGNYSFLNGMVGISGLSSKGAFYKFANTSFLFPNFAISLIFKSWFLANDIPGGVQVATFWP